MNEHEIDRLASAFHVLRPDWPHASLRTFIAKNLAHRPRRDVAVALAWVASESNSATPARVLTAGPWWKAAAVGDTGSGTVAHTGKTVGRDADPRAVCGICDMWRSDCEQRREVAGHEFVPRSECLPPTEIGALGKRGTCLAGPSEQPCQLITGHDGPHDGRATAVTDPSSPIAVLRSNVVPTRPTSNRPEQGA